MSAQLTTPLLPLSISFSGQKPSDAEPNIFQKSAAKVAHVFCSCAAASEEVSVVGDTCSVCKRDFEDGDKKVVLANRVHQECADKVNAEAKKIFQDGCGTQEGRTSAMSELVGTYGEDGFAALEARNSKLGICVLL